MAAGHVDRTTLESFYQNAGEVYDDTKTEGALEVLADQIDENWDGVLGKTNTTAYTPSAQYHPATKKYVDDALVGIVAGDLPESSVTSTYLADDAVTTSKLADDSVTIDKIGSGARPGVIAGKIYAYRNLGGL